MLSLEVALKFFVSECLHEATSSDLVTPVKEQLYEDKQLVQASIFLLSTLKKKKKNQIRTKRFMLMNKYKLLQEGRLIKQIPGLGF